MAKLDKINKVTAADIVCDKIKESLMDGTWNVGQKIPTEMELSQLFGVNRLTVRIAIQRLSTLGLLDIRIGDGTYIKSFDLNTQISELSDFYVNELTEKEVTEYRLVLGLGCIKMAVERRTQEQLDTFHALCLRFQSEVMALQDTENIDQAQVYLLQSIDTAASLHATLFEMSHNELMNYGYTLAKEPLKKHMLHNAGKRLDDTDPWAERWMKLYEGLVNRDLDVCTETLALIIGK